MKQSCIMATADACLYTDLEFDPSEKGDQLYKATFHTFQQSHINHIPLRELDSARLISISTLHIPPSVRYRGCRLDAAEGFI